eukprot:gene43575-53282_t
MPKRNFKGLNKAESKKRRAEYAEKWRNTRGDQQQNDGWNTVTENARFEAFYRAQRFIEDGKDWEDFMNALRTPLPASFRVYSGHPFAAELKREVHAFMAQHVQTEGGNEFKAVECMNWYPDGNAFRLGTDRRSIRKLESLSGLHQWLKQHTDSGNVTRQEAVSMVPPIVLDAQPHHKCLDMCASPGSKTSQLLEIVQRSLQSAPDQQGLVVANDVDTDRAYML